MTINDELKNKGERKEMKKKRLKINRYTGLLIIFMLISSMLAIPNIAQAAVQYQTITFSSSTSQSRSTVINIPNLTSVSSITSSTGTPSYSKSGNSVTVSVSDGTPTDSQWNEYKYWTTKTYTGTSLSNNLPSTYAYNDGTYTGTLNGQGVTTSTVQITGNYIPADTQTVSANDYSPPGGVVPATYAYNSGGYVGTLGKTGVSSLVSGSVAASRTQDVYITNGYMQSSYASTYYYNDGVYSGTLTFLGVQMYTGRYYGSVSKVDDRVYVQSYSGSATRPGGGTDTSIPSSSRTVSTSNYFTTASAPATYNYSDAGYVGTIAQSGAITLATGSIAGSKSQDWWLNLGYQQYLYPGSYYYNDGIYSGTLNFVGVQGYSGRYMGTVSKPYDKIFVQNYSGTAVKAAIADSTYIPSDTKTMNFYTYAVSPPATLSYNSGGYVGLLPAVGSKMLAWGSVAGSKAQEWWLNLGYMQSSYPGSYFYNDGVYTGTLTFVGVSGYNGRYTGTVTKPDDRVYFQNYSGSATKPAVDTRIFRTQYNQNYSGTVYKGGFDNLYSYTLTLEYTTKLDQLAPIAPIATGITSTSVVLSSSMGAQITSNGITQASGSTWTGLSPITDYTAYAYYPSDATYNQSPNSSGTSYTTLKLDQVAPTVPVATSITDSTVVLTGPPGTMIVSNGQTQASGSTWTGLSAATDYTAYAYFPSNASYNQSPNSWSASYTMLRSVQLAIPVVPVASSLTASSVVLTSSAGSMITSNGQTQASGTTYTFLSPASTYTAFAYYPQTATYYQGPNSANSSYTTPKLDQVAPVAPVAVGITDHTVVLVSSMGAQITSNGVTQLSGSTWTGLSAATDYSAFAYYPSDATHYQSPNSATTNYKTLGIVAGSISATPLVTGQGANSAPTEKVKVTMQLDGWITSAAINWSSPNNTPVTLIKTSGPDAQGVTTWSTDSNGIIVPHDVACGYPNSPVAPTTAPINLALTVVGSNGTNSFTDSTTNVPISDNVKITSFTTSANYANVGDTILLSAITTGYAEAVSVKFPWDASPVTLSNSFGLPAPYQGIWTANYTVPASATPNPSVPYTVTSTATNTFNVKPPAGSSEIDTMATQLTISSLTLDMFAPATAHRGDTLALWGNTTGKASTVKLISVSPSIAYTGTGTLVNSLDFASLTVPAGNSEANTWYSDQTHANAWVVPSDIADETVLTFTFEATDDLGLKKQDAIQVKIEPIVVVVSH